MVSQYYGVMAKIIQNLTKEANAKACIEQELDPYVLFGMSAVIPMVETRDVYVQDFIVPSKFVMARFYHDTATAFKMNEHFCFMFILALGHFDIHMTWSFHPADGIELLAFTMNGENVLAVSNGMFVIHDEYEKMVCRVRAECQCKNHTCACLFPCTLLFFLIFIHLGWS